jgi:hypothetical protein
MNFLESRSHRGARSQTLRSPGRAPRRRRHPLAITLAGGFCAALAFACGDRRVDVAVGAVESPLQAVDTAETAPSDAPCSAAYTSKGKEPDCEYTFDLQSCSATWTCDDGQLVTFTIAYGVDYGDFSCVTETHCVFGSVSDNQPARPPSSMDSCSAAPAAPIACPVATEADVRAYCAPLPIEAVPADCPPHDASPNP